MKLESNLNGVLDRVRRMPRDIRAAMARTLGATPHGQTWEKALAEEAKRTLWALAKRAEWLFVEAFLQTLPMAPFMNGFLARLSNPLPPVLAIEDFMMAQGLQTRALNTGSGPTLFSDFLNQFDQMMADWVATENRKDRRDWDKSDEDIGHFMGYLMLTPDGALSEKERAAKTKLWPHIAEYVQRRQTEKRLNADGQSSKFPGPTPVRDGY